MIVGVFKVNIIVMVFIGCIGIGLIENDNIFYGFVL